MATRRFTLGLIQMMVTKNRAENMTKAQRMIEKVANKNPSMIILPEFFTCPCGTYYFRQNAESIPDGEAAVFLSEQAKKYNTYLIGGSIPESEAGRIYNTSMTFGPDGSLLGKYRKLHLFDVDVPGKVTVTESEAMTSGNSLFTFDTPFCKVGIGICYDLRFPQMAELYAKKGCNLLVYLGAFGLTTGPAHWELLNRARSLDNQVFVATVSPARNEATSYVVWGHSIVTGPWGEIIGKLDHQEDILMVDIDLDQAEEVRRQFPTSRQQRDDLYSLTWRTD